MAAEFASIPFAKFKITGHSPLITFSGAAGGSDKAAGSGGNLVPFEPF
jgi:hypothetical protein